MTEEPLRKAGSDEVRVLSLFRDSAHLDPTAANELGLAPDVAAQIVGRMARLGLLRPSIERGGGLRPAINRADLARAIEIAFDDIRADFALIEEVSAVAGLFQRGADLGESTLVSCTMGDDACIQEIARLGAESGRSIDQLLPDLPTPDLALAAKSDDRAILNRGLQCRVIYPLETFRLGYMVEYVTEFSKLGLRARTSSNTPLHLMIFDREVAVVTRRVDSVSPLETLTIHHPSLVAGLCFLYDSIWRTAQPWDGNEVQGGPKQSDQAVLVGLAQGLSYRETADRLGVSERTVSRAVERLMGLAGVTTQLELGVEAVRRGWLN